MENRDDLMSIIEFLPVVLTSSTLSWPPAVVEALKSMWRGPEHSRVDSGEVLFLAISDIRNSLDLSSLPLAPFAPDGYSLFFDELMSREESTKWFGEILPSLASLLLRLPSLLETHYQNADALLTGLKTGLRILNPQEPGIVFLTQELIGALLACSFFCLFPVIGRGARDLPMINFDHLFESLHENYNQKQENKIKCIIHYFKRICSHMPVGFVSFERKVLPMEHDLPYVADSRAEFWSRSLIPLCRFEVQNSGLIEDQSGGGLEVDFANKYIGGGALNRGCLQEEIRFMINPELIAGMLFLPSMADNEAIEIVGAERFSNYTGYASSFRFTGDYVDKRDVDFMGRRKTRIIAIDALCSPRMRQYKLECLLREIDKAFCGFFDQSKYQQSGRWFQDNELHGADCNEVVKGPSDLSRNNILSDDAPSTSTETNEWKHGDQLIRDSKHTQSRCLDHEDSVGIVTGNWGCGAFGGDPELKTIIQWLAASQASRPFISYYTFGVEALQNLDQVSRWILSHEWTVGELWDMLVQYSSQRLKGKTDVGFLTWLLPSLSPKSCGICWCSTRPRD